MKKIISYCKLDFLDRKDCFCITILMFLFAVMVFFQLGSFHAPETTYTTTQGSNQDIVLDLGDYVDVQSISIFLGNLNTRHLSISTFNEVTGAWEIINGDATVESVFDWNRIDINYNLRYLGLVSTDDTAVFNELVVESPNQSLLLPVNASDYPELFDEQSFYPSAVTYMNGTMFDEVYHGRTAYEFIHHLNTYETTHPHLGKILISIGIRLFGMTPFGWRFMVAIFGILLTGVMYLFAKRLFHNTFIAFAVTFLLNFDCMHYNLSRIATIDIFAAFFILLMYFFLYEYFTRDQSSIRLSTKRYQVMDGFLLTPLALCGITMGFGIATKWTCIYAGIGLGVLFMIYTFYHYSIKKKLLMKLFGFCCIFFIAIPLIIYVLSFIPVVSGTPYKGLIDKAIQCSISMYNYHANLVAEHYYSSPFYEWPIIWMPLLDSNDSVTSTIVSSVNCMGNPAIWWVGIPCQLFVLYHAIFKKDRKAGFLILSYAAQYIPWMSISRITFIYHYFPSILFVLLMMAYTMDTLCKKLPYGKKIVLGYLCIVVAVFFLFFPVVSGIPADREASLRLRWLKDWILVL